MNLSEQVTDFLLTFPVFKRENCCSSSKQSYGYWTLLSFLHLLHRGVWIKQNINLFVKYSWTKSITFLMSNWALFSLYFSASDCHVQGSFLNSQCSHKMEKTEATRKFLSFPVQFTVICVVSAAKRWGMGKSLPHLFLTLSDKIQMEHNV